MEKILDCSCMSDTEFMAVQRGLACMESLNGARYFGFVNKDGMKDLTNQFGYIHTATLFKGGLLGAGVVLAAGVIGKHIKNKKLVESKKKKGEGS